MVCSGKPWVLSCGFDGTKHTHFVRQYRYLRDLQLDKELLTTGNFNIYDPINSEDTLFLDGQTLAHIEVLRNSSGGHDGTLLQLLSRCVTPYGQLILRP